MKEYRITIDRDDMVFAAAHFITYGGGCCEALHGHNYRVAVTLTGEPGPHALVHDFLALRERLAEMVGALDHRTLLPDSNPELELEREGDTVVVRRGTVEYRFPQGDVVVLPVPNTTAEMLAGYLADGLARELEASGAEDLHRIAVEVEESFGQSATVERTLAAGRTSPETVARDGLRSPPR